MLIVAVCMLILGSAGLVAGTALIYPPAALIVAGLLLLAGARMCVRTAALRAGKR